MRVVLTKSENQGIGILTGLKGQNRKETSETEVRVSLLTVANTEVPRGPLLLIGSYGPSPKRRVVNINHIRCLIIGPWVVSSLGFME